MTAAGEVRARHTCDYDWCRWSGSTDFEHHGDGEITFTGDPYADVRKIHCYAFVTDDGNVYEDEINLSVVGKDICLNAALTVDEATRLRDLLDTAIANRAEIRG